MGQEPQLASYVLNRYGGNMVFAVLGFSSLISFIPKKENKKFFLLISFAVLFVFAALRYNYGNDYSSYNEFFDTVKMGGRIAGINEIGYRYLNQIFPSFQLLIAFISLVFLFAIYKVIVTSVEPELYPLALFIFIIDPYLFLMSLSMIRESIAIILFILAVYFASKKRILLFVGAVALASLFHASAILVLPAYFLCNEKNFLKKKEWILLVIPVVLLLLYDSYISGWIVKLLEYFKNPNYIYYFENTNSNSLRATLLTSISFVYVCLNFNKLTGKKLMFSKLALIALMIDILGFKIPMVGRIGKYFAYFSIVAIPSIFIYNLKNEKGWRKFLFGYVFPLVILTVYLLRVYSFFANPTWKSFLEYHIF